MRVVSGEFRGRRLVAPVGSITRPTTDQAREAVFNSLSSMNVIDGAVIVDLFAGSGALGIEALSRGATRCTFVEQDRAAVQAIRDNLATLKAADRSVVVAADAVSWVRSHGKVSADVVFADPPYEFDGWGDLLAGLNASIVVAETGRALDCPAGWTPLRARRYGRTHISILEPAADTPVEIP
jgi:16S rRNA (guanine966-N2)-methyltransferase